MMRIFYRVEQGLLWFEAAVLVVGLVWYRLWEQVSLVRIAELLGIGLTVLSAAWISGWGWSYPLARSYLKIV